MTELRVRAPATSANLGPGFDSFALALPLLAEFDVRPARAWDVTYEDDGEGMPADASDEPVLAAAAGLLVCVLAKANDWKVLICNRSTLTN